VSLLLRFRAPSSGKITEIQRDIEGIESERTRRLNCRTPRKKRLTMFGCLRKGFYKKIESKYLDKGFR
jgi:hypothetical protein